MGNGRSRRSVDAFSMQVDDDRSRMYQEPLLEARSHWEAKTHTMDRAADGDGASSSSASLASVIHQLNCFFAVLWPVATTMTLTSLAVCYASDAAVAQAMTTYMYYQDIDTSTSSIATKSFLAFCNALLVVAFIAGLTFGIVLLYRCNCMKLFLAYCIFYSASLLALAGAKMVVLVLGGQLHCIFDRVSLVFVMYNLAVVGVVSIFYQQGIPTIVEQGYLITISLLVAWQLSQLPEWSIWMLLLLLGFWDLFAVLTPIGPLRCLVELVQERGTPLPGLLFQADVVAAHQAQTASPERADEHEFVYQLLHDPALPCATETNVHASPVVAPANLRIFHDQIQSFLRDHQSSFQYRAPELAQLYMARQLQLWRRLYDYYGTRLVEESKPYPAVPHVFPSGVMHLNVERGRRDDIDSDANDDSDDDKSIKLGLGDFIFYSVLVARAALHGFAAFVACFLSVLLGLAGTMYLLAHHDALPALPLSIFSGILAFVLSSSLLSPFLSELTGFGIFVI